MAILETPPLLLLGSEQEYIDRLKQEYNKKTVPIPEGRNVLFFLDNDVDCKHFICGKEGKTMNKERAQKILFIRYILENKDLRIIKRHLETNNIVFYCEELRLLVICCELKRGDWKCFTQHPFNNEQKPKFSDQSLNR